MRTPSSKSISAVYAALAVLALITLAVSAAAGEDRPQIRNIRFESADTQVTVYYDLDGPADQEFDVRIILRRENQKAFAYIPRLLTGDVGRGRFAGRNRKVVWEVKKEFANGLDGSDYYFEVFAEPVGEGSNVMAWLGVGAAVVGGGVVAMLLLSHSNPEASTAGGFPGPPGRP